MIIVTNTTELTVPVGQAITFNTKVLKTCNGREQWRTGTGAVQLNCNWISEVQFSANISGATADAPAQLTIFVNGAQLPETVMQSEAAGFNNVATATAVDHRCGSDVTITVVNNGTVDITVRNPLLFIKRIA